MRRAIKVLSVLATVCAMAWAASPAWASCGFDLSMLQGGVAGFPAGGIVGDVRCYSGITPVVPRAGCDVDADCGGGETCRSASDVNGYFWEVGFGDPADGFGNDSNSNIAGYPAFTTPDPLTRWIKGAPTGPVVDYSWFNFGVDNCISGGAAALVSTVLGYYIIDSDELYAVAGLAGTTTPAQHNDLDLLITGHGVNNNDVVLRALDVRPQLANVVPVSDNCVEADVLPFADGLNVYNESTDGVSPTVRTVPVSDLVAVTADHALTTGGAGRPCDETTGCSLTCADNLTCDGCITRGADLCWTGSDSLVIAEPSAGGTCSITTPAPCAGDGDCGGLRCVAIPTQPCTIDTGAVPSAECFNFTPCNLDVCNVAAPLAWDPPLPAGCLEIGTPTVDDHAVARALKSKGFTVFRWDATQFAVSHYNLFDVTRGQRRINQNIIERQGENDGSVTGYQFTATGRDIRGGKRFELEMVRTDGAKVRFTVE